MRQAKAFHNCCRQWMILVLVLLVQSLFGQLLTSDDLLSSAIENKANSYQENIDYMSTHDMDMPFFNTIEFRTETDEFNFSRQDYTLRFDFNTKNERKAYDSYIKSVSDKYIVMQNEDLTESLESAYENIVEIRFTIEKLNLIKEQLRVFRDKKIILQRMMSSMEDIEIASWISNENEIIELVTDSLQRSEEILIGLSAFNIESGNDVQNLDFQNWISIDKISEILDASNVINHQNIKDEKNSIDYISALAEYELEIAQSEKWFDFAQIKYQSDNDLNFQDEISLGASFRLPLSSNNRNRVNETALEVIENKNKLKTDKAKRALEVTELKRQIQSKIKERDLLAKLQKNQKWDETLDALSNNPNVSPLDILNIKIVLLNQKENTLDLEEDINDLYLRLLSEQGLINSNIKVNYLTDNLNQY